MIFCKMEYVQTDLNNNLNANNLIACQEKQLN